MSNTRFPGWRTMTSAQRRNAKMDAMFERARLAGHATFNAQADSMNSFQKWANAYARAFGFIVTLRGNWVELHKDGKSIECMSAQGVQEACEVQS